MSLEDVDVVKSDNIDDGDSDAAGATDGRGDGDGNGADAPRKTSRASLESDRGSAPGATKASSRGGGGKASMASVPSKVKLTDCTIILLMPYTAPSCDFFHMTKWWLKHCT